MRQIVMDQKLNEEPQPITATVHTDNPTPISLNGLTLQNLIITWISNRREKVVPGNNTYLMYMVHFLYEHVYCSVKRQPISL